MPQAPTATPAPAPSRNPTPAHTHNPAPAPSRNPTPAPRASDDEILGIASSRRPTPRSAHALDSALDSAFDAAFDDSLEIGADADASASSRGARANSDDANSADANEDDARADNATSAPRADDPAAAEPANLRAVFDANPELRAAWHDANAYREAFDTPAAARQATALLADVNRMDALFFSRRPEDHAALARAIADLDPASFQSLARAINEHARATPTRSEAHGETAPRIQAQNADAQTRAADQPSESSREASQQNSSAAHREAQVEFLNSANASAVESVLSAIESQVERLLPDGISKSARTRVVGEIYRELDTALRSNHQLASQMRDAFRSGSLDADHQRAIVSLITGRARQALPAVAKRVLNEWTSTLVSANRQRLTRQRTAERRVDIAGSGGAGNEGRRSMSPRDLDYARLSDADILNL